MEEPNSTKANLELSVQSSEDVDRMLGQSIDGKYKIMELLGVGSLAKVYRAEHLELKQAVAIKILLQDSDSESALRFRKEAHTLLELRHPNIVCIRDFGEYDHRSYLVMDLAKGKTLEAYLVEHGTLNDADAANIFNQVCEGLQYAHKHGIVHRDLKPANIMIANEQSEFGVQIVDFGIAKDFSGKDGASLNKMTQTGNVVGTPAYMSPEQCTGQALDPRSDIYSLGCVMYEAVSGKRAFASDTLFDCMYKHVNELPSKLRKLEQPVSSLLEPVIFKCLAKHPEGRYENAEALNADLKAISDGKEIIRMLPSGQRLIRTRFFAAAVDGFCVWAIYACSIYSILALFSLLSVQVEFFATASNVSKALFSGIGVFFFVINFIDGATSLSLPIVASIMTYCRLHLISPDGSVFIALIGAIINWLYHAILESSPLQGTLGKKLMGLIIVDSSYRRVSFLKASVRHILKPLAVILLLDIIRTIYLNRGVERFRENWLQTLRQPMHDKMASCLIIKRPSARK
jgi:serine/threonine protein kinase